MAKSKLKHPVMCVVLLILAVCSAAAAYAGGNITRSLNTNMSNLNELTAETAEPEMIVKGSVYAALGTYGSTYKMDQSGNILQNEPLDYYYLIPVNDTYCITLYTDNADMISKLDALAVATDSFTSKNAESIDAEGFNISAELAPMSEDELTHMFMWILGNGYFGAETAEEAAQYIIPYKLVSYNRNAGLPILIGGCTAFALFMIMALLQLKNRTEVKQISEKDSEE